MTDGSPSERRAASAGSQAKIDMPRYDGSLCSSNGPFADDHASGHQLAAVGEVERLEGVELVVRHVRRIDRPPEDHDGHDVERVGDAGGRVTSGCSWVLFPSR